MAADIETIDLTLECRKITAEEQQQEFCSYLGFQSETIIWDEYVYSVRVFDINRLTQQLIFSDTIQKPIQTSKVFC